MARERIDLGTEDLIYEVDRETRRVYATFNRPERMNAISLEMSPALEKAMEHFSADDDLWVAIITGAGDRAFCAGADLGSTIPAAAESARTDPMEVREHRSFDRVFKPIIAAVNGYCIAGGLEMMQGMDIRIASEQASFGLGEVRWGIVPAGGSHVRLPRQIPWAWAMELLLTGQRITAEQAYNCGLVNRVVPHGELMAETERFADMICANGPLAVRTAKEIAVRTSMGMSWEQGFSLESLLSRRAFGSEDAVEGPKAFMEKRQPNFKNR
jgi:enoyl-CoA hydratase